MMTIQFKIPAFQSLAACMGLLSLLVCTTTAQAEIVGGTHWMVRPGESTYSIARKFYPNDLKKREQFRIELMQANATVFKDGAQNMKVGTRLKLPAMAQTKPETTTKPVAQKVVSKITPDPEETIGRVIINMGTLEAENRGSVRTLKRNSEILKGDTLKTSNNSNAQIRLKDGALVSLRSNTEFQIEEYSFKGQEDGSEKSVFNLIKGGFRTITGLIGHRNKQNYSVRTTVATIGIRGTHYGLMLCEAGSCANQGNDSLSDGLYGGVIDGSIVTENESGISQFNNDQYFHIASAQTPPVEILLPPPVFNDTERPQQLAGENQSDEQDPDIKARIKERLHSDDTKAFRNAITLIAFSDNARPLLSLRQLPDQNVNTFVLPLPPKAPVGSGMALAFSHLDGTLRNGVGAPIIITALNSNNIFLEQLTLPNSTVISNLPFAIYEESLDQNGVLQRHEGARLRPDGTGATYVLTSFGGSPSYGGVNWGQWSGNFLIREDGVALQHDQNFHFIYSPNLTTPLELVNLGGLSSRIQMYQYFDGTLPTNELGVAALSPAEIYMDVDFSNHVMMNYSISANVDDKLWFGRNENPVDFLDLNRSFSLVDNSVTQTCLSGPCQGEASVIFIGDNAGAAMTSYSLYEADGSNAISGAGLLTLASNNPAPDNTAGLFAATTSAGQLSFPSIATALSSDNIYLGADSAGNIAPVAAVDRFVTPTNGTHSFIMPDPSQATLADFGTDNNTSVPNTDIIWGRWGNAVIGKDSELSNTSNVHFIYSNNVLTQTQLATLIGSATYNSVILRATDSIGTPYTEVDGTITMGATFGPAGQINTYSMNLGSLNLLATANNIPFTELGRSFGLSCSSGCTNGTASVQFIGSNAQGAITSFSTTDAFSPVSGTALLTTSTPPL
ncbi:MAG TPA: FecR domain-containing protein [Pseudomonadales bacterium]